MLWGGAWISSRNGRYGYREGNVNMMGDMSGMWDKIGEWEI